MKKLLVTSLVVGAATFVGILFLFGSTEEGILGTVRLNLNERTVISASAATTTVGTTNGVADFRNVNYTVHTSNATGTMRFACSFSDTAPTFSVSSSVSNRYDFVEVVDLEDGSVIDGDTGLVFDGSTDVRQFELNSNNFKWCTVLINGWSNTGSTSVWMLPANNQ